MKRLKDGIRSMFKRMGSILDSIHKFVWNLGPPVDEPFNPPREWYDKEGAQNSARSRAQSMKREKCADDSCNSIADPRCKGLNCTMHCAIFCQGRCGVPRPPNFTYKRRVPVSKMKDPTPPPSDPGAGFIN